MTIAYPAAVDEMFKQFNDRWTAGAGAIVGYVPEVRWQDQEKNGKPDGSRYWVRVSEQQVLAPQRTLSNQVGEVGIRRYEVSGLLFVQLFAPKSVVDAPEKLRLLAVLARDSYRGKTTDGGIVFSNVRINRLPMEELYLRCNVVAEYEFDELG
jgi:hypothetical protein